MPLAKICCDLEKIAGVNKVQSDDGDEWEYPPDNFEYRLMLNGSITLFRKQAVLDEAVEWFREHQYLVHTLDAAPWQTDADFHTAVAQGLKFPDYYGRNLAALNDCLSDLDVPANSGVVVVLLHYDVFARHDFELAHLVLDVFARNTWYFLIEGRKLFIFVQSEEPFIQLGPLGCRHADWNPKEWFDKDRV
jgi:RNAse (barnase) inhibitor barstar